MEPVQISWKGGKGPKNIIFFEISAKKRIKPQSIYLHSIHKNKSEKEKKVGLEEKGAYDDDDAHVNRNRIKVWIDALAERLKTG